MFTIPRSTPSQPAGSVTGGSGTSQVAYRNHMPFRYARSDSPCRCCSSSFRPAGEHVNGMFFRRPAVVQMLTAAVPYCQDRHRSSNGCAASGRNTTGLPSAAVRRGEPGSP